MMSISLDYFKNYLLKHEYNENMFLENGKINPYYNSNKKTGTIATIFEDHWQSTYENNKSVIDLYRPNASKEKRKVRKQFLRFEISILKAFHTSPLQCPKCGVQMEYVVEIA